MDTDDSLAFMVSEVWGFCSMNCLSQYILGSFSVSKWIGLIIPAGIVITRYHHARQFVY